MWYVELPLLYNHMADAPILAPEVYSIPWSKKCDSDGQREDTQERGGCGVDRELWYAIVLVLVHVCNRWQQD